MSFNLNDFFLNRRGKIPNSNLRAPQEQKKKKKKKKEKKKPVLRGHEVSIVQNAAPWQIVFGRCRIGGIYTFIRTGTAEAPERVFDAVITLAAHSITDIEKIYADDIEVVLGGPSPDARWSANAGPFAVNGNSKFFLSESLTGGWNADLGGQHPTLWPSNFKQTGRAHVFLRMLFTKKVEGYANGLPEISFDVQGAPLFNPYTETYSYSTNAARAALTFLMNDFGYSAVWPTDFDVQNWKDAMDVCDQDVTLAAGGTEKRYTVNGWTESEDPEQTLDELEDAMGGYITFWNGKWKCFPSKYRSPTLTITTADLIGPIVFRTRQPNSEMFNGVRGELILEANNWESTEISPVKNSTYATEDGRETLVDISLPFVTSQATGARLFKLLLEKQRQGQELELVLPFSFYQLEPCDTVNVEIEELFGELTKVFEVTNIKPELIGGDSPYMAVMVSLRETASGIYTDSSNETLVDVSPNTELTGPNAVVPPSSLTVTSGTETLELLADGTLNSRLLVEWVLSDAYIDDAGEVEVQIKKSSDSSWIIAQRLSGDSTSTYITFVIDGESYDVRVKSKNAFNFSSAWVQVSAHVAQGKLELPTDVSGVSLSIVGGQVKISWSAILDLDLSYYEVRRGASWASGVVVNKTKNLFTNDTTLLSALTYYWVKAIDTGARESVNAGTDNVTPNVLGAVTQLSAIVVDNNVQLDWELPSSGSYAISHYNVYKGPSATAPYFLGRVYGTFFMWMTQVAVNDTFWVEPVDVAGNAGPTAHQSFVIYPPPDYILIDSGFPDIEVADTTNIYVENVNSFLGSVITGQSWEDKFTNNSWTNIQDMINDGHGPFICPSNPTPALWEKEIDLGVVVAGSRISLAWGAEDVSGTSVVEPQIAYKKLSGDACTVTTGQAEVYAAEFQFIKLGLQITNDDTFSLVRITNVSYSVNVKKQTDSGSALSLSSGLKRVYFNLPYLSVSAINATALGDGSEGFSCNIVFVGTANPDYFDIAWFDKDGAQTAVDFSWSSEGVINPLT